MRRILVYLHFVTPTKTEQRAIPETLLNEELVRLMRCTPQTAAEKAFHAWLLQWKDKLDGQ